MSIKPMIFICGPSRSGTAMLRSALNQHPLVHIVGETHYFDDLRIKLRDAHNRPLLPREIAEVTSYFRALSHRPYGHGGNPALGSIREADLVDRACELGGGLDAYFEAYCALEGKQKGKLIFGEKTPRHIFRIDEMLSVFPDAYVICMARDPRAVVASYRNWKNQGGFSFSANPGHLEELRKDETRAQRSYHPATISLLWKAQMNGALRARRDHGRDKVRIQRYEDLVESPGVALRTISQWLHLDYDDRMLNVPMHNSSYSTFNRKSGISREALRRWETNLLPEEIRIVDRICAPVMAAIGYTASEVSNNRMKELALWLRWPLAISRATLANRHRMGNVGGYLYRRLRLAIGR